MLTFWYFSCKREFPKIKMIFKPVQKKRKKRRSTTSSLTKSKVVRTTRRRKTNKKHKIDLNTVSYALLVVASILFLVGLLVFNKLNESFVSASGAASFDLKEADVISLLMAGVDGLNNDVPQVKKLTLVIIDKSTQSILAYDIPPQTELDVPGVFGVEQIGKTLALGQMKHGDLNEGIQTLQNSIQKLLGFGVDRYLVYDYASHPIDYKDLFSPNPRYLVEMLTRNHKTTNLTIQELYAMYQEHMKYDINSLKEIELTDDYLSEARFVDADLQYLTADSMIPAEKINVAVLNGTNEPGIATQVARMLKNHGMRVVMVDNSIKQYEQSYLISSDGDSLTTKRIRQFLDFDDVEPKDNKNFSEKGINRADIVVIIGIDKLDIL